jgi:hypothetical protein
MILDKLKEELKDDFRVTDSLFKETVYGIILPVPSRRLSVRNP